MGVVLLLSDVPIALAGAFAKTCQQNCQVMNSKLVKNAFVATRFATLKNRNLMSDQTAI